MRPRGFPATLCALALVLPVIVAVNGAAATRGGSVSRATVKAAPSPGASPPATSPAPRAPAPTPGSVSWFAGGEGLFVPAYYDVFKDLDLTSLTPVQKERFVHWVNTEYCTCGQAGCQRDTIANCYTNDPRCPRAPGRIREILEAVRKGAQPPGAHAGGQQEIPAGAPAKP